MNDQDERARIRSGRRRFLLGVFGALFVFAVASFLVGLLQARGDSSFLFADGEPPTWAGVVGVVLAVLGLLVEVAALVWAVRSGRYRAGRDSALWAVSWRRRRELARQVRRDVVHTDEELPLLRRTAGQMARQRWLVVLFAGLVTMQLGQALLQYSMVPLVLFLLPAVLFVPAGWQTLRDSRRAQVFLRAHPAEPAAADRGEATGPGPAAGAMPD